MQYSLDPPTIITLLLVLAFVLLSIAMTIQLVLVIFKWVDRIYTTPKGESKEWIWSLPTGQGFAISFTKIDNNHGVWKWGFFVIRR